MTEPNYPKLVAKAREHFRKRIENCLRMGRYGAAWREYEGYPTLVIVGAGESGKDTVAQILIRRCGLHYEGGTSHAVASMVAFSLGLGTQVEECYAARRHNREFWFQWMHHYTIDDSAGIVRLSLAMSDFSVGVRRERELRAALDEGVVNMPVWVEREGYDDGAHEITKEMVLELGGRVVDNGGDLRALERNVVVLAEELGLPINNHPR